MALVETPICNFGWQALDFELKGVDGNFYKLNDISGANGTLLMFICNHCPYVKAVITRLVEGVRVLQEEGIGVAAIMSNATEQVEADSFENMQIYFSFAQIIDFLVSDNSGDCLSSGQ